MMMMMMMIVNLFFGMVF